MALTKEEIIHLGELARVRLGPEEIEKLSRELPSVLEFVATLEKAPTQDVTPMTGGTKDANIFRDDDENVPPLGSPEELRASFYKTDERGGLVVPQIFDRN